MKYLFLAAMVFFASYGLINSNTDKNEIANVYSLHNTNGITSANIFSLTDKTVNFLWRDSSGYIVINEEYCKTISEPEKAAIGYVATFIGSECWWDGDIADNMSNLKCKILTALNLGYQCSDKHLGFLKQWFKNDTTSLKNLMIVQSYPILHPYSKLLMK
jgi:hypothetical protein